MTALSYERFCAEIVAQTDLVRSAIEGLLLVIYRRRSVTGEGIEVAGDRQLLDFWLERVGFG